jgi:hypothetical protein
VFRQEPTTGERVGGALGAIGGAAAVTAAESPELIPVVAPITAKAGAVAGRAVEERLLRKQSSDGNPTPESCWNNGWTAAIYAINTRDVIRSIMEFKIVPYEPVKDDIRRSFNNILSKSIDTGCKRYNKDKVDFFRERFLDALNKEDWPAAREALAFLTSVLTD